MRVVFLGSGAFGVPTLRALHEDAEVELGLVVTSPDRPAGRGRRLRATPIKQTAEGFNLPVRTPERVEAIRDELASLAPDVLLVVAYGQILRRPLLEIPELAPVNLHASLLPKYRGAAPIAWAIMQGETETGLTTFVMDEGMDTGPILHQEAIAIGPDDTAGSLHDRLAELGPDIVEATLRGLGDGTLTPTPQDEEAASYAPKIPKARGELDWRRDAESLRNTIRGLNPKPGAFTHWRGDRLKIPFATHASVSDVSGIGRAAQPGEIVAVGSEGPVVQTGDGRLELTRLQPPGKPAMRGIDLVNGYGLEPGERLGTDPPTT